MSLVKVWTRTAGSGGERTNHETTAPPMDMDSGYLEGSSDKGSDDHDVRPDVNSDVAIFS